jgi:Protein of unknown function (DUF1203)
MGFLVTGLDRQVFIGETPFDIITVDESPGAPCRVTLEDVPVGEQVGLFSYAHNGGASPYAQSGPVFVRLDSIKEQVQAVRWVDAVPDVMARRMLSLRAYDDVGVMVDAVLVSGNEAVAVVEELLSNAGVVRVDAHYALRGCFAAHIWPHDPSLTPQ